MNENKRENMNENIEKNLCDEKDFINASTYKSAFRVLHSSHTSIWEVNGMNNEQNEKKLKFRCQRGLLVTVICMSLLFAMSCIAYATTDGKIVDDIKVRIGNAFNVKMFVDGKEVDADVKEVEDGVYEFEVGQDVEKVKIEADSTRKDTQSDDNSEPTLQKSMEISDIGESKSKVRIYGDAVDKLTLENKEGKIEIETENE